MATRDPEALLRMVTVRVRTGLGRSTIYKLIANGEFPKPIRLTRRSSAWTATSIDRWIADRIAASASIK